MKRIKSVLSILILITVSALHAQTPDSTAAATGAASVTALPVDVTVSVTPPDTAKPITTDIAVPAITTETTLPAAPAETTVPVETAAPAVTTDTSAPAVPVENTSPSPVTTPVTPPDTTAPALANSPPPAASSSGLAFFSPNKNIMRAYQKAGKLYESRAYAEAIPLYEKALASDRTNKEILGKLGDCYRFTNNTQGQITCYGGLVNTGNAEPIQELYYGQALLENGEAEKARPYFEKFSLDSRGKEMVNAYGRTNLYKKNADAYKVEPVGYNSPESDFSAVKYRDMVVFASTRKRTVWIKKEQAWTDGNYLGLYTTEGSGANPRSFMQDLDSKFNDGPICFSKDFNTVYITRNNSKKNEKASDGTFKLKLMEATLDQNGFSFVRLFPFNNNNYNFAHPSISADGLTLYFSSDMTGGKGGMDIYRTRKDSLGLWGTPENLGDAVNTAGNEMFPFIAANDMLYFSSNGHDGIGGLDIFEVKLTGGKPGKVYNMGEPVNSKDDDFGVYLGEDSKTGFLSSNRKAGGLDDDIYSFEILREVKHGKEAVIVLRDKENSTPLDSVKLLVNGDTVLTNDKGEYSLQMEDDKTYIIKTAKTEYFNITDSVSSAGTTDDVITKEMVIEKDPKLFLRALITDAKTGDLLDGVNIKVTDIAASEEVDNYTTTGSGDYFKQLYGKHIGDKITYLIRLEKQGYLERTVVFSHNIEKAGEINMNQSLNLTLGKVEVGMDLAKMIDIKPIYFDLGKSDIRKDAAEELDKIVQIMNEYPNMFIELGSHTDCRSSAASNMKLSTERAKASAEYIVKRGINKMRIVGRGYGESRLLNNCACEGKVKSACPEEEHMKNRRTEFIITRLK